jgi:hypothetical protein
MPSPPVEPVDLLDLKLLPAWLKEPADAKQYEDYQGEEGEGRRRGERDQDRHFRKPKSQRPFAKKRETDKPARPRGRQDRDRRDRAPMDRDGRKRPSQERAAAGPPPKPLEIEVRFVPHAPALENVTAQIKSGSVAYSLFALARLFLEKPERYDVILKAKPESPFYQLGENGALSVDRGFLEGNAFRFAGEDFYKIDITQSEPIKGNFTNVARCKLSHTLLGPTNHHSYQARLRNLYEQRFSRRMSFADYQRQIEIMTDPAAVEQWKEEARKVTTFTTLREESPLTFASATEAEKHFRQTYLPELVRRVEETAVGGVSSRHLADRALQRAVEDAWTRETRSPSHMMQELAARFREAGVYIFRHRKGMLFVSPIRVRPFGHDGAAVSPTIGAIFETVTATPRINRKQLAEKLIVDLAPEETESKKLALTSDLHWLISEGYVIEFNDGSLDLPRTKAKPAEVTSAVVSTAETGEQAPAATSALTASAKDKDGDLADVPAESSEANAD